MSHTDVAYNGTIVLPLQQKAVIPEENPIPVPFFALQIRHALHWERNQVSLLRNW